MNADKGKGICVYPNYPENLRSILQLNCKDACLYFEPCRIFALFRVNLRKFVANFHQIYRSTKSVR